MRKALVTIGGILVAVLGSLFIVPAFIDWNTYRGALEEEVSRVIGREVRVGGAVSLRLLPFPYVSFEKVRITDNAGVLGEPFFRADAFTMWLSVAPLLRGTIEASEVELRRPVVTLAVDAAGAGNWADFKSSKGTLPFAPSEVALQAVNVIDGTIAVQGPQQAEIIRIEQIFGEVSAEAIDGPYKFRGTAKWRGEPREIRGATAKADADGSVRFKTSVRAEGTGSSYIVDARVVDVKGRPRLEGELTARLATPSAAIAATGAKEPAKARPAGDGQSDMLELKAKIAGDATRAALSDMAISFDQGGQPQLVTGNADVTWLGGLKIGVQLGSLWLDLDRLAGAKPGEQPFDSVRTLVSALVSLLPETGEVESSFNVDQVNLGGEAVSNVKLAIARARGPMQVNELRASLPGGTRLELNGVIATDPKGATFLGDVGLRGASYVRLMGWGAKGYGFADHRSDGPFSLSGRLSLRNGAIEVTEATAELMGTPLTGELRYGWEGRRTLAVTLDGQQIDVSALLPGGLDLESVRYLFWPATKPSGTPAGAQSVAQSVAQAGVKAGVPTGANAGKRVFDTAGLDLKLKLKAAEVTDGTRTLRNVDADAALTEGRLTIPALRLTTAEGLGLELEGEVADVAVAKPRGILRWVLDASDPAGMSSLASLLQISPETLPQGRLLESLLPMRMAGSLRFAGRTESGQDIAFDGVIRGHRLVGSVKLDAGVMAWRQGPVDIVASGDMADPMLLASLLGATEKADGAKVAPATPAAAGRVALRAIGQPAAGLLSTAAIETADVTLRYDGRIVLPKDAGRDLAGTLQVAAKDAEQVLALSGLPLRGGRTGVAIDGAADIATKDGLTHITPRQLKVGDAEVGGTLTLGRSGSKTRIDADLKVDAASVAGLTSVLLDRRSVSAERRERPVEAATIWPDAPFDMAALEGADGGIKLRAGKLSLAPDVALEDADIELRLADGKMQIAKLEGRALGGTFSGRANLERATSGAVLSGAIRIDGGNLATLGAPGAAAGPVSLNLQFDGRALSPSAMITVLTGKGEIDLGAAKITRISPAVVQTVADQIIESRGEIAGEAVKTAVRQALATSLLPVSARKVGLQIADGTLKTARTTIEADGARAVVDTVIDLSTLKLDSEWRLEPKAAPKRSTPEGAAQTALPSVTLVYTGRLGQLAALEQRLSVDALERELAVRKMERDVEELERLRKQDEERARQEAERVKAIEEERARAAAASMAASGAQPSAPFAGPPAAGGGAAIPPSGPAASGPAADPQPTPAVSAAQPAAPQPGSTSAQVPASNDAQPPQAGAAPPEAQGAPRPATRPAGAPKREPFRPFSATGEPR